MNVDGWRRRYGVVYLSAMWRKEWIGPISPTRHEQFWEWRMK